MTDKIPGGYILVARQIEDSSLASMPPYVREIWYWILRNVTYSKNSQNRGKVLCSYQDIIDDLTWKVGFRTEKYKKWHCERAMSVLMNAGMIATTRATRGTWIEALNYAFFQDPENYESNDDRATSATRAQHERLYDIRKKGEERKEEEIQNPPTSLAVGSEEDAFENSISSLPEKAPSPPKSPAPPAPFQEFIKTFNELTGRQYAALPKYQVQYRARLKLYTPEQIIQAATVASTDAFLRGANDKGTDYLTVEYMLRNDAQIDKYLNFEQKGGGGKKYAIKVNGVEREVSKAEYDAYKAKQSNQNL